MVTSTGNRAWQNPKKKDSESKSNPFSELDLNPDLNPDFKKDLNPIRIHLESFTLNFFVEATLFQQEFQGSYVIIFTLC